MDLSQPKSFNAMPWKSTSHFVERCRNDAPLRNSTCYLNQADNPCIAKIELLGYDNGNFYFNIRGVNKRMQATINKLLHDFIPNAETWGRFYDLGIMIPISDHQTLGKILSELNRLDTIEPELIQTCHELFDWYHENLTKRIPTAEKTLVQSNVKSYTDADRQLKFALMNEDLDGVKKALECGADPNLDDFFEGSALIWWYFCSNNKNLAIGSALLQYGANPHVKHRHLDLTIISHADDCNRTAILEMILQYALKREFNVDDVNSKEVEILKRHHARIANTKSVNHSQQDIIDIKTEKNAAALLSTIATRQNNTKIVIETKATKTLSSAEIVGLFNVYDNIFGLNGVPDGSHEKFEYFKSKLKVDTHNTFIDIVLNKNGKIVGLNLFEIHEVIYNEKPRTVYYYSLGCVESKYRGTRLMSLLSFRVPHALKMAHPNREIYVFYDAIHLNSYRQVFKLKHYPMHRTGDQSSKFAKKVMASIYGSERASLFDGYNSFFLKSRSFVRGGHPIKEKYDLPWMVDYFKEITQGKGGIPVLLPISTESFEYFAEAIKRHLNGYDFSAHLEFIKAIYSDFIAQNNIERDAALWQGNHALPNALSI